MKRFIFSILCVSVFFIGVGALVEKTGAKFKSDEKALALIAKARQAIGGDSAIGAVQSMRIVGRASHTFKINGVERTEDGETEIAMQFPDKMMKTIKIGHGDGAEGSEKIISNQVDVVVVGEGKDNMKVIVDGEGTGTGIKKTVIKKDDGTVQELTGEEAAKWAASNHPDGNGNQKIVIKKGDGTSKEMDGENGNVIIRRIDGDKATFTANSGGTITSDGDHVMFMRNGGEGHHDGMRHNEMLRLTLGLLLTAPQGMDVEYTYGGEGDVDGTSCNIVVASFGGQAFQIYLGQSSNLPVMMSYTGFKMPQVFKFKTKDAQVGEDTKDNVVFTHKVDGPGTEKSEFQIKFSDYRSTGGVQLPYKWTQTVGGEPNETIDVTSYEINPANIAEKFQNQKVMVRTKKPDSN